MSKASLIVGNSNWAIKDSSLLGYNINDSNIYSPFPFDVTRATPATRVDKDGLIVTDEEILSGELITNGDFSDGSTGWTLGTGWSIGEDKAVADILGYVDLRQGGVFEVGKKYKVLVQTLQSNSGVLRLYNGSTLIGEITSVNSYVFYITATSDSLSASSSSAGFNGSISNFSVVEVNRNNLARIDYLDSTKGILLTEPQSTNLMLTSDITDNVWNTTRTTPTSGYTSPSADLDAYLLTEDTSNNTHYAVENIVVTDTSVYTFSVFAKPNGRNWVNISFDNGGYYFDLDNKVVGTQIGSPLAYSITEFANGFIRLTVTSPAIGSMGRCQFSLADSDGSDVYQGDGVSGAYVWGFQLEEKSFATSYIPTNGSIVTRNLDQVTNGGEVSTFNSEGVLYVEIASLANSGNYRGLSITDGSLNNLVRIYYTSTANRINIYVKSGNVISFSLNHTLTNSTQFNKIAIKYKENDFALWVNGVEVATDTSGNAPISLSELSFDNGAGGEFFFGKTKQVQVFKKALTDAELIKLTTI